MKRFGPVLLFVLVASWANVWPVAAQGGESACPALVEEALGLAGESCAGLDRNTACYGHTRVRALTWDQVEVDGWAAPGDTAAVMELASLATFPLDVARGEWGIALLSLQADLPEALPGQAVTFVVYGDTELRSEVSPEAMAAPPPTCTATATGGVNVRMGPGTTYAIAGGLAAGDEIVVTGRNGAGDWLRVAFEGREAWVYAPLFTVDCEVEELAVVEPGETRAYTAPMQAFYLTTGLGEPACAEAPRDGLLVQAPQEATVHFRVNGVEVALGSTAFFFVRGDGSLVVSVLGGTVTLTAAGETQVIRAGQCSAAAQDSPPATVPCDREVIRSLPVDLLPEPVEWRGEAPRPTPTPVPVPAGQTGQAPAATPAELLPESATFSVTVSSSSDWSDSGVFVSMGQTYRLDASGQYNICVDGTPGICRNVYVGPTGGDWGPAGQVQPEHVTEYQMPDERIGILIARIGNGPPFAVGESRTFVADADGSLQFRVNDWHISDNAGLLTVRITLIGEGR